MKNQSRVIVMTAVLTIGLALWLPGWQWRRVLAQSPGLKGSYGFTVSIPYMGGNSNPVAVVGVLTFDGAGNATGSETVVLPDPTPGATTVQVQPLTVTGTYTMNADGTGSMTTQTEAGPATIAFVVTDGGTAFNFVQTAGANVVVMGTGRRQ